MFYCFISAASGLLPHEAIKLTPNSVFVFVCLAMAEDTVARLEPNIVDDLDVDVLLQQFVDDSIFDLDLDVDLDLDLLRESWIPESNPPSNVLRSSGSSSPVPSTSVDPPPLQSGSLDSVSSFVNYIEKFLMDDVDWGDGGKGVGEDGLADFFSGSLPGSGSPKGDVDTPEAYDELTKEDQSKEMKEVPEVVVVEVDDDFASKKRRRQMRNRESAMMSRERKNMYVEDLEMKSKHLDIECRRLDYRIRCCMAENMVLRQNLQFQKDRSFGASLTKQESAVLFVESLLLGSLFWFVSLVCLFLVPRLRSLHPNPKGSSGSGRNLAMVVAGTETIISVKFGNNLKLALLRLGRLCRGLRATMKFLFPLHAVIT